jgi:hypothetical protein
MAGWFRQDLCKMPDLSDKWADDRLCPYDSDICPHLQCHIRGRMLLGSHPLQASTHQPSSLMAHQINEVKLNLGQLAWLYRLDHCPWGRKHLVDDRWTRLTIFESESQAKMQISGTYGLLIIGSEPRESTTGEYRLGLT